MGRTVANIYEDTRTLLNQVKVDYDFKSDDQAIRYLCQTFLTDERSRHIKQYLEAKAKREQEG